MFAAAADEMVILYLYDIDNHHHYRVALRDKVRKLSALTRRFAQEVKRSWSRLDSTLMSRNFPERVLLTTLYGDHTTCRERHCHTIAIDLTIISVTMTDILLTRT